MKAYRIVISRHGRLLGHFESDTPWAEDAIRDLLRRLPGRDGYRTELFVAHDERRLLESGPDGLKVLSRKPLFQPIPVATLLPDDAIPESFP